MAVKAKNVVQWKPGVEIAGVVEETKIAKDGDPQVTHGLLLLPNCDPIRLLDKDGKPTKAKVGETITAGRAHVELDNGNTELVLFGDWVVSDAAGKVTAVLTDAEAREVYDLE